MYDTLCVVTDPLNGINESKRGHKPKSFDFNSAFDKFASASLRHSLLNILPFGSGLTMIRHQTLAQSQWLFTKSALESTPSRDDGITLEQELGRRKLAVGFMRSLALRAEMYAVHSRTGPMF